LTGVPDPTVFPMDAHVTNVRINGGGEVANDVAPGSTVTVLYDWKIQAEPTCSCPGCLQQIYVGLAGVHTEACGVHTLRGCPGAFGANVKATFVAPSKPGIHYISVDSTWEYNCTDKGGTPKQDPAVYVGAICVK